MKVMWKSLVVMSAVLLGAQLAQAETITLAGSSTIRPIVKAAAKTFKKIHKDVKFVIGGGGSSVGVKSAGSGKVMIGMASRDMKDKEKAKYSDLVAHKIGVSGVAVIAHKSNSLSKITKQQVQDIYVGKVKNWKEVGGPDLPIYVVGKNLRHATTSSFLKYFGLEAKAEGRNIKHGLKGSGNYANIKVRYSDTHAQTLAAVVGKKGAIAFVPVGSAQKMIGKGGPIKTLDLDGVPATTQKVADGSYPLRSSLNVLTKGQPSGMVKKFVDFLASKQGQKIVAGLDYVPVNK